MIRGFVHPDIGRPTQFKAAPEMQFFAGRHDAQAGLPAALVGGRWCQASLPSISPADVSVRVPLILLSGLRGLA
jgi:hypothetical protein